MNNNVDAFNIHRVVVVSPILEGPIKIIPYPLPAF
jgi:hypothetical protein